MTSEVYVLLKMQCSRCNLDYEPGIMYDITKYNNVCTGFGANGLTDVPRKCMKCPQCGESRRMTRDEEQQYADWYKRITP
jgi:rubredoxin